MDWSSFENQHWRGFPYISMYPGKYLSKATLNMVACSGLCGKSQSRLNSLSLLVLSIPDEKTHFCFKLLLILFSQKKKKNHYLLELLNKYKPHSFPASSGIARSSQTSKLMKRWKIQQKGKILLEKKIFLDIKSNLRIMNISIRIINKLPDA